MVLPLPTVPLTIPVFGTVSAEGRILPAVGNQDRGSAILNVATNSTVAQPAVFVELDQCDQEAYLVGNISMTIQRNTEDCRSVLGGTVSIKVRVPYQPGAGTDVNTLIDQAQTYLFIAMSNNLPSSGGA